MGFIKIQRADARATTLNRIKIASFEPTEYPNNERINKRSIYSFIHVSHCVPVFIKIQTPYLFTYTRGGILIDNSAIRRERTVWSKEKKEGNKEREREGKRGGRSINPLTLTLPA